MHRVFVYGTLKRGFRNHRFLKTASFVGEAHTLTRFRMLDGRFPVLRDTSVDPKSIAGEAYDVDDETLKQLDDLEDIASGMYERITIDVALSGQRTSKAFIYIGGADYWDKQEREPYLTTDQSGHLNWIAPDMRPK